jgi:HK97 family phage portal protein
MNLISRFFNIGTQPKPQQRAVDLENYFLPLQQAGGKTIMVTTKKSVTLGVVFECVDVIKRTLSLVTPKVVEQKPNGKYPATGHPLYPIINSEPYTLYSASDYYGQMVADFLLYGNAYALILRSGGRVVGLRRLEPEMVEPYILEMDGVEERWYKVTNDKRATTAYNQADVIHLMDFNFDGIKGLSRIQLKRNTITDAGQIQIYSTDMYKDGVSVSGYLESDRVIGKEELDYLRKKFEQQATTKNGGIAALPQGFKYHQMQYNLPFADAELVEAKKFGVEDIARIFGVPLSLIQRSDLADNKADAEYNRFLATTIAPLTILLENEHNRKLFTPSERGRYYMKFELKGLYRVDMLTRYQAHQIALSHGFMNKDEVRDVEGMNPIPQQLGQTFYQMLNTIPLPQAETYYLDIDNDNDNDTESN